MLPDPEKPLRPKSGLIVIGIWAKHGARELNYSSDIDIVVFSDPNAGIVKDSDEATDVFARMVRRLWCGSCRSAPATVYVFRTDLRLRPDPGSTPLAFPLYAALNYYESRGQNWERAAFIKARPVAGDLEARRALPQGAGALRSSANISILPPFPIFIRFKRQIHAHRGFGEHSGQGPQCQDRSRRHSRDRVLRPDPAADRRRARMPAAQNAPHRRDAGGAGARPLGSTRRRLGRWLKATGTCAMSSTASRWCVTSRATRLPESEAELARIALMMGEASTGKLRQDLCRGSHQSGALLRRAVREGGGAVGRHRQSWCSPARMMIPARSRTLAELGFERPADISAHHPHLAFTAATAPPSRGGARAADRIDAGAAGGVIMGQPGAPTGAGSV